MLQYFKAIFLLHISVIIFLQGCILGHFPFASNNTVFHDRGEITRKIYFPRSWQWETHSADLFPPTATSYTKMQLAAMEFSKFFQNEWVRNTVIWEKMWLNVRKPTVDQLHLKTLSIAWLREVRKKPQMPTGELRQTNVIPASIAMITYSSLRAWLKMFSIWKKN